MNATQPEAMRTLLLADVDKVLDAPWIVRKMLSAESLRLLKATRQWAASADEPTLTAFAAAYDQQPALRGDLPGGDVEVMDTRDKLADLCRARQTAAASPTERQFWDGLGLLVDALRPGTYVLTGTLTQDGAPGLAAALVMLTPVG